MNVSVFLSMNQSHLCPTVSRFHSIPFIFHCLFSFLLFVSGSQTQHSTSSLHLPPPSLSLINLVSYIYQHFAEKTITESTTQECVCARVSSCQ